MDAEALRCNSTEGGPTYFELTTAIALLHFAARGCDAPGAESRIADAVLAAAAVAHG